MAPRGSGAAGSSVAVRAESDLLPPRSSIRVETRMLATAAGKIKNQAGSSRASAERLAPATASLRLAKHANRVRLHLL